MLLVCVLACGHAVTPAASPVSVILAGPTVLADSLHVAATDPFGAALAQRLAPGATVRIVSDRGALDLIDSGGDALVTDWPAVIRYAASRAEFAVIALPWHRQYAFISRHAPPISNVVDAVHGDARPATSRCPLDSVPQPPATVVFYFANDSIARSLAERLVGLGVAQRAVANRYDRVAMESYIQAWPIDSSRCDIGSLHAVPLVETRPHLIVRRGSVGVVADTAGGVKLETTP